MREIGLLNYLKARIDELDAMKEDLQKEIDCISVIADQLERMALKLEEDGSISSEFFDLQEPPKTIFFDGDKQVSPASPDWNDSFGRKSPTKEPCPTSQKLLAPTHSSKKSVRKKRSRIPYKNLIVAMAKESKGLPYTWSTVRSFYIDKFGLTDKQARNAATNALAVLVRQGDIQRLKRGVYINNLPNRWLES